MLKHKKSHRRLAIFFLLIFVITLVPIDAYASNNGPIAPEATSFEPVDASDMVNLTTGDMSYVLPLLNVPSPEGGYPIALSYHAGIALDQEATWVGLGWSLNPGSLNRFANGTPDDWTKSETSEFFFDGGAQEDYYNFSIGGTLPNGITIGLGASWGSNQAFGGSVSIGYMGFTAGYGTNSGFGFGVGGLYFDRNGMRFSVGASGSIGGSLMASASFDVTSGEFNFGVGTEIKTSETGSLKMNYVGASLSSSGLNANSVFSSQNNSTSSSSSKYEVKITTNKTGINLGFFWFGYGHTRVTYSLFDIKTYKSSGAFYPEDYKIDEDDEYVYSQQNMSWYPYNGDLSGFFKADTYEESSGDYRLMIATGYYYEETEGAFKSFVRPNYDNYEVNSQGLSGKIIPYSVQEQFVTKQTYKVAPGINYSNDLGQKTNFHLLQSNASFLRVNDGKFIFNQTPGSSNMTNLTQNLTNANYAGLTREGNAYSTTTTPDGNQIRSGDRMRAGNYVEFFTNSQLISSTPNGFIEAKGINRAQDPIFNTELKGIGAYKVTTPDGKTYHYSLPVYQYEMFYKNFKNPSNENENYFEKKDERKYATHWLLTAITGSDYVDINNNSQVDKDDYGYWVEFQYGKWSDGYCWRTPAAGYREMVGSNNDITSSSYGWGRKQLYYLDVIKTRTHSALFVKKLREDDKSNDFVTYTTQISNTASFNKDIHCIKHVTQRNTIDINKMNDVTYRADGTPFVTPYDVLKGKKTNYKYYDIPKNATLALDKILLLKNDDVAGLSNSLGNLTNNTTGYLYYGFGYTNIKGRNNGDPVFYTVNIGNLYSDLATVKSFAGQIHQNVLDQSDIVGLGLEQKAINGVQFNYNYELARNTPSSSNNYKGRLSLKSVDIRGKEFRSVLPLYSFDYHDGGFSYNKSDRDVWGYHKTNPKVWSLKTITTPTGSKITMNYEADSYRREAITDPNRPYTTFINQNYPFFKGYKPNMYQNELPSHLHSVTKSGDKIIMNISAPHWPYSDVREFIYKGAQVFLYYTSNAAIKDVYDVESSVNLPDDHIEIVLKKNLETAYHSYFVDQFYPSTSNWPFDGTKLTELWLWIPSDTWTLNQTNNSGGLLTYMGNGKSGGGLRVSSIDVSEGDGSAVTKLKYSYINPHSAKISGITSYEPFDEKKEFPLMSLLPAPQVMYEYVTITSENNQNEVLGKTLYQFNVLRPVHKISNSAEENINTPEKSVSFGKYLNVKQRYSPIASFNMNSHDGSPGYSVNEIYSIIKDRLNQLGTPRMIQQFNSKNQLLSERNFVYDEDLDTDGQQGVLENTSVTVKRTDWNTSTFTMGRTSTILYPSSLSSVVTLENSYRNEVINDKYDFLTGQVLETTYNSSDGKTFKTKVVPAYAKYPQMGSKLDNNTNRNMLLQNAAEYTYILDNGSWKETGVGMTTWNNEWAYVDTNGDISTPTVDKEKIWRKHKTYQWNGLKDNNGIFINYNSSSDDGFNWSSIGVQPSQWKKLSETTIFDHYSMPLELKDINGNKITTKMGDNDSKQVVSGDGGYNEIYFTSGEYLKNGYWLEPEVRLDNGQRSLLKFHTGKYSIATTSSTQFGVFMRNGQHKPGKYKLSVWVHKDNAANARIRVWNNSNLLNFSASDQAIAGDWVLKVAYLDIPSGDYFPFLNSADGSTVYYDDLMIRPISSTATGFVYDESDRLTYIVANNGLATKFTYDQGGRLLETHVEVIDDASNAITGGFKLKAKNTIKYKNL
jgi:YD repeat-containing protein